MSTRAKKRKKKKIIIFLILIILFVCIFSALSFTVLFPIKEINVEGSMIYTTEEIMNAGRIDFGDNLLSVSKDKLFTRIREQLPYVGSIEITKIFPSTLNITVIDAMESFCYEISDTFYTADSDGYVLSKENKAGDITLVISNCTLDGGNPQRIVYATDDDKIIIEAVNGAKLRYGYTVDSIDIRNVNDVILKIDGRFTVEIGNANYIEEKFSMLDKMIKDNPENVIGIMKLKDWTPENHTAYFEKTGEK